jgi:hypothetical protein
MLTRLIVEIVLAECLLVIERCVREAVERISPEVVLLEVGVEVGRETRMVLRVEVRVEKLISCRDFHGVDAVYATYWRRLAAFTRGTWMMAPVIDEA